MALAGSLQISHDLGFCKDQGFNKKFKVTVGNRSSPLLRTNLPYHVSFERRDSWRANIQFRLYRPMHSTPFKHNLFRCYSFQVPNHVFQLPAVKSASTALKRSFNVLQGSPSSVNLAPAVGIIVFALWGLGPLLRQCRTLLLHKSENSWKKSTTHYVMTSYIQPLMLWTAAILICRAIDPLVLPTEASQIVKQRLLNFIRSLSTVLALAFCLSSMIQHAQKYFMETTDTNDTRNMGFQFTGKAIYSAVWVAAVSLFMELLGFSTQKWLTAGGLGTVLLTLAGREIFTNFLSSAMIHATRPFIVNEWIQTKIEGYEVSGTVEHVGWWSPTIVRGEDREAVHIPNHKFTVNVVRNLSQKSHWRIKTHLAISHLDVHKINNIVADMRKVLAKNPQVEQQRLHRRVFLDNINPENQALLILISCFVKTSHYEEYLCVKEAILLDLLRVISHHRARLATPIRTVQKIYSDADLENIPFADSIYNRGGVASDRPLLLIDTPYKINGEDRTKRRTSQATGEQDGKTTWRTATDTRSDSKAGATSMSENISKGNTSELKADSPKVEDAQSLESKDSVKAPPPSISDLKADDKETAKSTSKAVPKTGPNMVDTSSGSPKVLNSRPQNATETKVMPESKQQNATNNNGNSRQVKSDGPQSLPPSNGADRVGGSQLKQESDKLAASQPPVSRMALDENIVLGVALDGSKRTLPIEEEMDSSSSAEVKEMTAVRRNANESPAEKDKKDSQPNADKNSEQ